MQTGQDIENEWGSDKLGHSVSLSSGGSVVAVGCPENQGNGSYSGEVSVYENQDGTWVQLGNDIEGEDIENFFGNSVSLGADGLTLVAGAPGNTNEAGFTGNARVYQFITMPDPCDNIVSMNLGQEYTGILDIMSLWMQYPDCYADEPGQEKVYQFTTTSAGDYELIAEVNAAENRILPVSFIEASWKYDTGNIFFIFAHLKKYGPIVQWIEQRFPKP